MVRYINGKDKPTEINVRTGTGNGSNTDFTVTQGSSVAKVLVTVNGVAQAPTTDYTISGTTLSFVVAPANNDDIVIREYPV
jgi:hypothetical protein